MARQLPEVKNYNGDMERPPDIGRLELRITPETRLWKGGQQGNLCDLADGDVLLVNYLGEQTGAPHLCADLFVGAETHKLFTERQAKKLAAVKK